MFVALATFAGIEIELEIRVAADVREKSRVYRRTAEVCMDDDAGGVDDAAERRFGRAPGTLACLPYGRILVIAGTALAQV